MRRAIRFIIAGSVFAAAPMVMSNTSFGTTPTPASPASYPSFGTVQCSGHAFVSFVFEMPNNTPEGFCWNRGAGNIPLPERFRGPVIIALDNESGHAVSIQGITTGSRPINWCYESGWGYALGPPIYGGVGGEWNISVSSIEEKSASSCPGANAGGTTEPGMVPERAPRCSSTPGGHVFILTTNAEGIGALDTFYCLPSTPARYPNLFIGGMQVAFLSNSTGRTVYEKGSNFEASTASDEAISPVSSRYANGVTAINVGDP